MAKFAQELLLVAGGGAVGASVRYLIAVGLLNYGRVLGVVGPPAFPWATMCVNLVGCFAIGLLAGWGWLGPDNPRRLWLAVGFLGALTTFSAFGLESWQLLEQKRWGMLAANVLGNVFGGLGLVMVGVWLARIGISPET
jgi:fluoride exporter